MDVKELEKMFAETSLEMKNFVTKANEQFSSLGKVQADTQQAIAAAQKQLDAIDEKLQHKKWGLPSGESLLDYLKKHDRLAALMKDGSGRAKITLEGEHARLVKTTLTSDNVGATPRQLTGVLPIEPRTGPLVVEARRALRVRDLIASRPTSFQVVDFVKVSTPLVDASPQVEAASKWENAIVFTSDSERIKTIATFLVATRQLLQDWGELESFLRSSLAYYVRKETEDQLLSGDNTGENLNGLIPQATAFNTALLPSSYTKLDIIGWAIAQLDIANEVPADWVLVNPQDLWSIRLTKDSQGRYILGDPQSPFPPSLFNRPLIATTAMTQNQFLVGSGDPAAAEIRERMEVAVELSTEDSDNFRKNLITIRAEERLALVVYRPASYIYGSLTSSPA